MDLLKFKPFRTLSLLKFFPLGLQILTLVVFIWLIYGGIVSPTVDAKTAGILRNTNLAALIVWSLWWPLIIVSAVILGRIWCQVCPMELINSFLSKIGLKKKVPSFFKTGWVVTIFYTLALIGFIRTYWAHRYPRRMAIFFLFLFGVTFLSGLIFEKRSFCNYICPVGHLLGLYACCSSFEWRARDKNICEQCRTKDCIATKNYYSLTRRSCTSNLYPAAIQDNRRCLLCTQCLKVCPYKNLRFSLRKPMTDFFHSLKLTSSEFFLLFLASGLVIWEISEEWEVSKKALEYFPNQISKLLGATGELANFIHAFVLFIALPAIIFLIPGFLAKLANRTSLFHAMKKFSLILLPFIASTHLLKALFRITSRLPYYALAIKDPVGFSTANQILSGQIELDKNIPNLISPFLSYLALLIFAGVLITAWLIVWKSVSFKDTSGQGKVPYLVVITLYCSAFILTTIFARF